MRMMSSWVFWEVGTVFSEMVLHYIIHFVGRKYYSVYQGALSI